MKENKFDLIYESIKRNVQLIDVSPATDKGLMLIKEDISKPIYIVSESVGKRYLLEEAIFFSEGRLITEGIFDIVKEKLQSFIEKVKSGLLNVITKGLDVCKAFCEKILNSAIVRAIRAKLGLDEKFTEDDCKDMISCVVTEAKDDPDTKQVAEIKIDDKKASEKIQKVVDETAKTKKQKEEVADELAKGEDVGNEEEEKTPTKKTSKEKKKKEVSKGGSNIWAWMVAGVVALILIGMLICYLGSLYFTIIVPFIKGAFTCGPMNIIKVVVCGGSFFLTYKSARVALKKGGIGAWAKFICMSAITIILSVSCLGKVFDDGTLQDRTDWLVKSCTADQVFTEDQMNELKAKGKEYVKVMTEVGIPDDKIDKEVGRPHNIKTVAKKITDTFSRQFRD